MIGLSAFRGVSRVFSFDQAEEPFSGDIPAEEAMASAWVDFCCFKMDRVVAAKVTQQENRTPLHSRWYKTAHRNQCDKTTSKHKAITRAPKKNTLDLLTLYRSPDHQQTSCDSPEESLWTGLRGFVQLRLCSTSCYPSA